MTEYLQTTSSVQSHQGLKRTNNEDYVTFYEPGDVQKWLNDGQLYIVADGVGGEASGEFASRYAAEKVSHEYFRNTQIPPAQRIEAAMTQANADIQEYTQRLSLARMATTLVAAVVRQNKLMIANVGDSRAYLIREGQVEQVSQDHNLVGEMSRAGIMTEAEAMESAVKNRLMRSIGGHPDFKVDIFADIELKPGDRILLCTDGLTRYAAREDIAAMVTQGTPQEVTQRLVDYALKKGGADNISVALVEIGPLAPLPKKLEARGHTPHAITLDALFEKGGKTIVIKAPALPVQAPGMQVQAPGTQVQTEKNPEVQNVETDETVEVKAPAPVEKLLVTPKTAESMPTVRVQVPPVGTQAGNEKTMEIKPPEAEKTSETSKPAAVPLPIPPVPRAQPVKQTAPLKPPATGKQSPVPGKGGQPAAPGKQLPPDPFARKKGTSPFKRIFPLLVLILFVVAAVAVLAFLAIQIKNAVNPPLTATATQLPTKATPTPTKPQATATVSETPEPTSQLSSGTPGTTAVTASTPQATGSLSLAPTGLPAEFCVKQIPDGGNLTNVLAGFGVAYKPAVTYFYFICPNSKFSDGCKGDTARELPPDQHKIVQALWWLVIPDQIQDICIQKGGEWVKK